MAPLSLTLLGGFQARLDQERVLALSAKKAQALLAYLAMPAGRAHPRDKLAALLWGEMREPQARAGLRQVVFVLRKCLGEGAALRLDGETIALDPARVETDVAALEECASRDTLAALERAAGLWRGDLLEGLSLQEAAFEEWLSAERLRLRELAINALARLLAQQRVAGMLEAAVHTAVRLLTLDPLQETVHRALMRLYADLGRRGAALRQYQLCVGALQRELRAEPERDTKALYHQILLTAPARSAVATDGTGVGASDRATGLAAAGPPPSDWPFVGRAAELGRIQDAMEAALGGRARLIAVIGEAGIGKSRLVAEVAVHAGRTGARVLAGRCHESEQVLSFGPWIDALRRSHLTDDGELLRALGPAWRAELSRLLPDIAGAPPGGPMAEAAHLFEAIAQLLERVALAQPVLLVLEDLHWADEMSLRLLAFIGRRLARWRMLAVVTVREEELTRAIPLRRALDEIDLEGHLERCPLGPLGQEDSVALARVLLPPGEAGTLGEQLWRASEGNPFILTETVRALPGGRAPAIGRESEGAALPLPERVRNLIAARIERLGDQGRRLAAVAAVIGRPFDFALVQGAADLGAAETAEGIEELVRHRILKGRDESLEFTHDRIRETVHAGLLPSRRALIHRRVAEVLEQLDAGEPVILGSHYREGQVWSKAVLYLRRAGAVASQRGAQRDAVVCYEQALSALARLPDGRETRQLAADLRFNLAYSLHGLGEFERATACLREAEDLALQLDDPRRLGKIHAGLAFLLGSEGDLAGATRSGLRALSIATSRRHLDLQVWTSIGLGRVYYARGEYREATARMRWLVGALNDVPVEERFGRGGLLPSAACRGWLALSLAASGDFAEALAWAAEAVRIAEGVGGCQERAWSTYCVGRVHLARGDADRAIPLLEDAAALCGGRIPLHRPRVIAGLGRALTMVGRLDAALPLLDQALAELEAIKLLFGRAIVLVWTGAAHLEAGRAAEAEGCATAALELSRRHGNRGDEASALHALGEIATRRQPAEAASALERSTQAVALAGELGMAPLEARCHLSLGALHRQAGRMTEARNELARSVDMLSRMQMRRWVRSAEELLAAAP